MTKTPDHLRYFWDRALKLWTVTVHDADDNQIGFAEYAPRREILIPLLNDLKVEHGVTKVLKDNA